MEEFRVCGSVSRAISAGDAWPEVLAVAENPALEIIVSNTTEIGIVFDEGDQIDAQPPATFPGKLTAALHQRYKAFQGDLSKGVIILPCELLEDNGEVLKKIVLQLADTWQLDAGFKHWVQTANQFCNTLVDRIVPGTPAKDRLPSFFEKTGFQDGLLTAAEVYSLYAIEGDDQLRKKLAFPEANPAIIVDKDITPYRERKLRLLNAVHTINVPAAFLTGNKHVIDMMNHPLNAPLLEKTIREEIGAALDMDPGIVRGYIDEVLSRFRNPYLKHALIDITFQSTSKMKVRVLPMVERYYRKFNRPPEGICFGFAAYLLFMKSVQAEDNRYFGRLNHSLYPINDNKADYFYVLWQTIGEENGADINHMVRKVCQDESLWGINLAALPDFCETVANHLNLIIAEGIETALQKRISGK